MDEELCAHYSKIHRTYLQPISEIVQNDLSAKIHYPRIDSISVRAKSVDSFVTKSQKRNTDGEPKYSDPLNQIQDQIGARITTYYLSDVVAVEAVVKEYYRSIETTTIVPDSPSNFGYVGRHLILLIPDHLVPQDLSGDEAPRFFELQIKTLFQHAWAQAEHDITYKTQLQWTDDSRRKVAFTAAQAWGADQIFEELHKAAESD